MRSLPRGGKPSLGRLAVSSALALGAVLALSSCSSLWPHPDTCDGGPPHESIDDAAHALVKAALADDADGICRVASRIYGLDTHWVTPTIAAKTKEAFEAAGITPENLRVSVGEMEDSAPVTLSDGTGEPGHELTISAVWVPDDAYTLTLPAAVDPYVPTAPPNTELGPPAETEIPSGLATEG